MISMAIIILGCILKSFWLILVGIAVQNYFDYKLIKRLEDRIEELENENSHRS